jgi:hypothetical protein
VWLRLWQQQRMRQLDLDSPAPVLLWRRKQLWQLRYVKWLRLWLRQRLWQQRRMRQLDLDSPASVLLWRQQRRRMRMLLMF